MELPKSKLPAETQDPRNLIIFSKVKQGKSSALAELPNNLMLDTEGGLAYIEALKVRVTSVKDIKEVWLYLLSWKTLRFYYNWYSYSVRRYS